jgi:hypothetical protein
MRHRAVLLAFLLAVVVAGPAHNARAQGPVASDGRVLDIQCADAQMQKRNTPSWRALHAPQDIGLPLFGGDQVKCAGTGYVEILVPEGTKQITKALSPFPIATIEAAQKPEKCDLQSAEIPCALRKLGIVGATRGRAGDSRILWPADGSAVLPEHFVIRWTPVRQKITLSILTETKDATLWGPAETDGEAGELKSEAAASALAEYKTKPGTQGLILTLTIGNASDWEEAHFSVLKNRQEQELNAQLDFWNKNSDGLAQRLGRGYSYSRQKLFLEAADEYDAALKSAPGSRYLLEDALQANRLAGRAPRVKELESQIAALPAASSQ